MSGNDNHHYTIHHHHHQQQQQEELHRNQGGSFDPTSPIMVATVRTVNEVGDDGN